MDVRDLRLLGGRLCIDFVNTIEDRASEQPHDLLSSYVDLARWGLHVGLLDESDMSRLLALVEIDQRATDAAFGRALNLREAMHRLLLAIATGDAVDSRDLMEVRTAYRRSISEVQLEQDAPHFRWGWITDDPSLDRLLWPISHSVVELLTKGDLRRVKTCDNHGCGWLFYDQSKNRSRRWCSMEGCGSRVKMRRQYARQRSLRRGLPAKSDTQGEPLC